MFDIIKALNGIYAIVEAYNLTVTDAINIFLNRAWLERELPFPLNLPSPRLKKAMQEAEENDLVRYNTVIAMMSYLKS